MKLYYDTYPVSVGYSIYTRGRQTAVQYQGSGCGNITPSTVTPVNPNTFLEMYNYNQAGLIVGNELLVSQMAYQQFPLPLQTVTADLEATYTYNDEGTMTGMTYPSSAGSGIVGDSYTYSFDSMNRPIRLTDQTNALTLVSNVQYGPANEMTRMDYGGISEGMSYNSLLQLTGFGYRAPQYPNGPMGITYTYSMTNNNGKIQSQTDAATGEVVTYQYDALNRLVLATSNSTSAPWGQKFTYDGFGNLTDKDTTAGSATPYHATFNSANNREYGPPYDFNGNRLTIPNAALGYDVENRMVTANPTGVMDVYGYGRGNRRVYAGHWQYSGSQYNLITEKVNFYSVTGQKLGTYQLQLYNGVPGPPTLTFASLESRVWFGTKLVYTTGLAPVIPDRLGSNGTYFPYGEERGSSNPPADQEKFATYTRDSVTGLDYAVNRYYYNVSGRFLTADPHDVGTVTNPASWNHYAYAGGDPVGNMDLAGLDWCPAGASDDICAYMAGLPDDDPGGMCVETAWSFGYTAAEAQCPGIDPGIYGGGIFEEAAMEGQLAREAAQQAAPPPSCEELLAQWIDSYLGSYKGMTQIGSPLLEVGGATFVRLGELTGVDPAFILGIARAESSLATNPNIRGGKYNVYGNSTHFKKNYYTNYIDPTNDAFNLISQYISRGLTTSSSAYKVYEGEATWQIGFGNLISTQTALFGDPNDIEYSCDDSRRKQLAAALWGKLMTKHRKGSFCFALMLTLITSSRLNSALARTVTDTRTGLIINYPDDWEIDNDSPVFTIVSFPLYARPRQLLVPMNGAEIVVMRAPNRVDSIADWLARDRIRRDRGYNIEETTIRMKSLGKLLVTAVRWSGGTVIPQGKSLDYYFTIGSGTYKVGVLYRGQARAKYFEHVLLEVFGELRFARASLQKSGLH